MDVTMAFASVLAPVVLALVQVVKTSFPLPKNFIPLLGLLLGIIVGYLAYPFTDLSIPIRMWAGALAGLTSVGLFETFNTRSGLTTDQNLKGTGIVSMAAPIMTSTRSAINAISEDSNSASTQDVAKNFMAKQKDIGF